MERDELERLSSKELHDRAMSRAVKHLDVGFLWRLIEAVPAAEAASGHLREAQADARSLRAHLGDFMNADEGDLADALRPLYVDYLARHP